jgi:hypothetical protein
VTDRWRTVLQPSVDRQPPPACHRTNRLLDCRRAGPGRPRRAARMGDVPNHGQHPGARRGYQPEDHGSGETGPTDRQSPGGRPKPCPRRSGPETRREEYRRPAYGRPESGGSGSRSRRSGQDSPAYGRPESGGCGSRSRRSDQDSPAHGRRECGGCGTTRRGRSGQDSRAYGQPESGGCGSRSWRSGQRSPGGPGNCCRAAGEGPSPECRAGPRGECRRRGGPRACGGFRRGGSDAGARTDRCSPDPSLRQCRSAKTSMGTTEVVPIEEDVRRRPTLPRSPPRSTIGAERLSFRVRDGTGRFPFAMAAETLWRCGRTDDRTSGTAQWTRSICGQVLGLLVPVSFTSYPASTSGLSTR